MPGDQIYRGPLESFTNHEQIMHLFDQGLRFALLGDFGFDQFSWLKRKLSDFVRIPILLP